MEIVESMGAEVMNFSDYLETGMVPEKYVPRFGRLGADLFKLGFTFVTVQPGTATPGTTKFLRGVMTEGMLSVLLPRRNLENDTSRNHGVEIVYIHTGMGVSGGLRLSTRFYPIWDVESVGLEFLLDKAVELAKP